MFWKHKTTLVEDIKKCIPEERRPIHHHEPIIKYKELDRILDRVKFSGPNYLVGNDYLTEFRDWLFDLTDAEGVVLTNSGTSALHLALKILRIQTGDGVLVPTNTYIATANAVSYVGAIPHFMDGSPIPSAYQLRKYLDQNPGVKAIIITHLFGLPADMKGIMNVAKDYKVHVIEDAAQALGTTLNGQHVGTFGDVGILSFNNNKILTTNGGGALITNTEWIAATAEHYVNICKKSHPYLVEHDGIGYNYHMNNINAAIGLSQTSNFKETLTYKQALHKKYENALYCRGDVITLEPSLLSVPCESNYWMNVILVDDKEKVLEALIKDNIYGRASFTPLHTLSMYKDCSRSHPDMPQSIKFFKEAVCLPSGAGLL